MFVSDLRTNYAAYKLPVEFVECLPEYCPTCGSPTEISEVLTGLHCSNPRCPDKVMIRITAICKALGVLGFGESTVKDFLDMYDTVNPLSIFALEEGMPLSDRLSTEVTDKVIRQIKDKKNFTLWEYVKIAQIPGVQSCAKEIFSGYRSLEDAYTDIEDGGVRFIQKKLGVAEDDGVSVRAMQVYNNLMEFKEDLFDCLENVNIIDLSDKIELNIYCSDQAGGGFKHKKDFYSEIERRFGDRYHFNIMGSISKKLNYLIWAGADGSPARYTNKVETVRKYQEQGYDIPILTADQFIAEMEVKCGNG